MSSIVVAGLLAYLLGAIPTAYLLGRWRLGIDVSTQGSGNIGASNLARLHKPLGALTLAIDGLKGWVPAFVGLTLFASSEVAALLALTATVGHCWSVYRWNHARKGGKGVATLAGAALALAPPVLGCSLISYLILLRCTGYRAISTVSGVFCGSLIAYALGSSLTVLGFGLGATVLLGITHRQNLRRIWLGQEERGGFPTR